MEMSLKRSGARQMKALFETEILNNRRGNHAEAKQSESLVGSIAKTNGSGNVA
jgi:hypothetical protein